jgi:hypothetical protein
MVGLGEDFLSSLFERVVLFALVFVPIAEKDECGREEEDEEEEEEEEECSLVEGM